MQTRNTDGVSVIARPLAQEKLLKRALKTVKKAAKTKVLRRGVREVQKALRRHKGQGSALCILAGDTTPVDVIVHLPAVCEAKNVPYVFVPSKAELGQAAQTKRASRCVLLLADKDW